MAMAPGDLAEVLKTLKSRFNKIDTITCYGRSKSCSRRAEDALASLKQSGLSWCFIGIESGSDDVLSLMKKGSTGLDHLKGCRALMASGIDVAAFIMPGLAGGNQRRSEQHVGKTLSLLNEIRPKEVRIRSLSILEGSPLYGLYESGDFEPATEDLMIEEIRMFLEGLQFDCSIETYQMTNVLFNKKGPLKQMRHELISEIDAYQNMPPFERAQFRFSRYLHGGYVHFLQMRGRLDATLQGMIADTEKSLESFSLDAEEKVEQAIFAIKSKGVP